MKSNMKKISILLVLLLFISAFAIGCKPKPTNTITSTPVSGEESTAGSSENADSSSSSSEDGDILNPSSAASTSTQESIVSKFASSSSSANSSKSGTSSSKTGTSSSLVSKVVIPTIIYKEDEFKTLANSNIKIMHTVSNDEYKALLKKGQTDVIWATANDFKIKYGGKVTVVVVPYGSLIDKTINLQNSGQAPDLVFLADNSFPSTAVTKVVQAMEDLKDSTGKKVDFRKSLWSPLTMEAFQYGGKTYAINYKSSMPWISIMFYNETMFKQAGLTTPKELYKQGNWTWENFEKAGKKLTKTKPGSNEIDVLGFATWNFHPSLFTQTNDTSIIKLDSNGKYISNINDPRVVATFNFLHDAFQSPDKGGYMNLNSGLTFDADFPAGKIAMVYSNTPPPSTAKFDWDCVPMPYGPDNAAKKLASQIFGYGIPTGSKNPEGALAFMYMMNDPKYVKPNVESTISFLSGFTNLAPDRSKGEWNYENYRNSLGAAGKLPTKSAMDRNFSDVYTIYWNMLTDLGTGDMPATVIAKYAPVLQAALEKSYGG